MKNQKKLFENVSGNQFKLITESVTETIPKADLVREGLKKIFANGNKEISYQQIANVGMGYIKDVTTARKCALQESVDLAPSYGYTPDDNNQKFVKEVDISPEKIETPEESREVQIGKEIIKLITSNEGIGEPESGQQEVNIETILALAKELIKIHSSNGPAAKPGNGTKPLSGWDTLQLKSH